MKALVLAGLPVLGVLAMPMLFVGADDGGGVLQHPDIPVVALQAYVDGATAAGGLTPPCTISWALLAAIGKVESDQDGIKVVLSAGGRSGGDAVPYAGIQEEIFRPEEIFGPKAQ